MIARYFLFICCASAIAGCATIQRGSSQEVHVSSDPSGMILSVDDEEIRTPATLELSRGSDHVVEGPFGQKKTIYSRLNSFWTLAGYCCYLIPGIVDSIVGSNCDLSATAVHFDFRYDLTMAEAQRTKIQDASLRESQNLSSPGNGRRSLDLLLQELREFSKRIELPRESKLAVLPFGDSDKRVTRLGKLLSDSLTEALLAQRKASVVSRENLELLFKEKLFEEPGDIHGITSFLHADYLIVGVVDVLGSRVLLNVNLYAPSSEILSSMTREAARDTDISELLWYCD